MATPSAIGILANKSIERIEAATGITLPKQGRDMALVRAQQLRAIADYLEAQAAPQKVKSSSKKAAS